MRKTLLTTVFLVSQTLNIYGSDTTNIQSKDLDSTHNSNKIQSVITEFSKYLGTLPGELRQEIIDYRIAIVKLNNKKTSLYSSLDNNAQEYLKKETEYKKKIFNLSINPSTEAVNGDYKPDEMNNIINEYYTFVGTITPEIRKSANDYKLKISKINKEKSRLYVLLSQSAQNYLKKEQKYKNKISYILLGASNSE